MKQYLLSVYQPEGTPPAPEVLEKIMRELDDLRQEMKAAGAWVFSGGLNAPGTATVLRSEGSEVLMTDGPFAEAKDLAADPHNRLFVLFLDTYHVTDPGVLYNKGNQWAVPGNVAISGSGPMDPYYVIMRLPAQAKEEFVLILPFVPNGRSNMIAWLGGQSDVPNYGKGVSFGFPSSLNVYGPAQVEAAINQDPAISSQRTLWGQQGSTVIFGNLLVMPIEDSLLYVQPLYLESSQTQLPQLKRVIVFYRSPQGGTLPNGQTQAVTMAPTLGEALATVFGASPSVAGPTPGVPVTPGAPGAKVSAQVRALIDQANKQFDAAQTALKAGDFAEYGRQVKALQQTLSQLRTLP